MAHVKTENHPIAIHVSQCHLAPYERILIKASILVLQLLRGTLPEGVPLSVSLPLPQVRWTHHALKMHGG